MQCIGYSNQWRSQVDALNGTFSYNKISFFYIVPKNDAVVVVDPFKRALRSIYTGVTVTVPLKVTVKI